MAAPATDNNLSTPAKAAPAVMQDFDSDTPEMLSSSQQTLTNCLKGGKSQQRLLEETVPVPGGLGGAVVQ